MSLRFGTSGIPRSSAKPGTVHGIARARELGLDHLEMAWVNGVKMSDASADAIREAARKHDLTLTAHAPYYVNLCGQPDVVDRSVTRLQEVARLGSRCGAESFCFHAGFYGKVEHAEANARVVGELQRLVTGVRAAGHPIDVRTELTGKATQMGSLEEVLDWGEAVPGVLPCVDFSHRYARHIGEHNRYEDFAATLQQIGERLGAAALKRLHIHISGIQYGPKGERKHEPLVETKFRWKELLRALKDLHVEGWVVSESPCMEDDALLLQKTYKRMK